MYNFSNVNGCKLKYLT